MKLLLDADGCPVVDLSVSIAKQYGIECLILCDTSHEIVREGARTIVLSKGPDSVDYALVNRVCPGDLVVTQDYGLAAMCLARHATVLNQDGLQYDDGNLDALLAARHAAGKIRRAGGRLRGAAETHCAPGRILLPVASCASFPTVVLPVRRGPI